MAALTNLQSKLAEVLGLAMAAQDAAREVRGMLGSEHKALDTKLAQARDDARETQKRCTELASSLEGKKTAILDEAREAHGLGRGPALVGVGAEDEVGPGSVARGPEPRRVLLGTEPADLELHAGEPLRPELGHLLGDVLLPVVAADRDYGQAVAVATPEPVQRLTERLADGVPDGGVGAGGCG